MAKRRVPNHEAPGVSEEKHIEVTRIQARQAVLVAVITAVSSIVATLLATKSFDRSLDPIAVPAGIAIPAGIADELAAPPLIFVASADPGQMGTSTERCKRKATAEMGARRGKVIAVGKSWIALEWRDFGIMVMCRDEIQSASVIVAGRDSKANGDLAVSLRAAVLE